MKKTKQGELYDNIYITSFGVKVVCPDSEFAFYNIINKLAARGYISELAHRSAELQMFWQGYKIGVNDARLAA